MLSEHRVEIVYCRQCRWLLRAAWVAQELLTTFEDTLAAVTLKSATGGIFEILVNGEPVASRAMDGGFVELKEIKQRVRDRVAPEQSLGHSDTRRATPSD